MIGRNPDSRAAFSVFSGRRGDAVALDAEEELEVRRSHHLKAPEPNHDYPKYILHLAYACKDSECMIGFVTDLVRMPDQLPLPTSNSQEH